MLQLDTLILSSNKTILDPNVSYTAPLLYPFGFYQGYIHAHGLLILMLLKRRSAVHLVFIHLYRMGTGAK